MRDQVHTLHFLLICLSRRTIHWESTAGDYFITHNIVSIVPNAVAICTATLIASTPLSQTSAAFIGGVFALFVG